MTTISCPLVQACQKFLQNTALQGKNFSITYAQWEKRVHQAQKYWESQKIKKGSLVPLRTSNQPEDLDQILALWRMGAIVCFLPTREPQEVLQSHIKKLQQHKHFLGQLPNPATILFSSGSTGEPKIIVHALDNHHFNALGANENIPVTSDDRWLLSLPLYHVSGLSILFRVTLGGGRIVFPSERLSLLENLKAATIVSLVPTQLIRLLRESSAPAILRKLKTILLGGAPIPSHLLQTCADENIPVYPTYGLTEMASQVATTAKPFAQNPELRILAYRETSAAPDGEILVRGKTLFAGYLTDQGLQRPLTADGWFPTGDMGKIWNEEERQFLQITGRKDNMFIAGGENVYPEEIERHLTAIAGIEEAVVVAQKDQEFGCLPVAFLKFFESSRPLSIEQLQEQLKHQLPSYKIPRRIIPWPAEKIPASLKLQRQVFQKLVND